MKIMKTIGILDVDGDSRIDDVVYSSLSLETYAFKEIIDLRNRFCDIFPLFVSRSPCSPDRKNGVQFVCS